MATRSDTQTLVPVIATRKDHRAALARIEALIAAGDPKGDAELEALGVLVENYERKTFPVADPDPIEVLEFRMEQLGLNTTQLAERLDINRGRASELLNRKRRLTLDLIRLIADRLAIPAGLLVAPYTVDEGRRSGAGRAAHG